MTKKKISEEVKKAWNGTNIISGIKISVVGWKNKGSRMVIKNDNTFEESTEFDFIPLTSYDTQKEIVDALYKVINK